MQIDWGEATVYLNGEKIVVNLFCARLCYSDTPFVRVYRRQNEESFLEANVHALEYFGGVPRHVIFDSAKVAVKDGFGAHAKKQAGYSALSAHYGFEAVFCNPVSGNEKGLVEGLVGYIRRNTCVPVPRVNSMDELNDLLEEKCRKYLSHHIQWKPRPVGEMFEEEKKNCILFPHIRLICADVCLCPGRSVLYGTVHTNNYSVYVSISLKRKYNLTRILHTMIHQPQFLSVFSSHCWHFRFYIVHLCRTSPACRTFPYRFRLLRTVRRACRTLLYRRCRKRRRYLRA